VIAILFFYFNRFIRILCYTKAVGSVGIFGQSRGKIKIHERKTSNETLHKGAFQQNKARARRTPSTL